MTIYITFCNAHLWLWHRDIKKNQRFLHPILWLPIFHIEDQDSNFDESKNFRGGGCLWLSGLGRGIINRFPKSPQKKEYFTTNRIFKPNTRPHRIYKLRRKIWTHVDESEVTTKTNNKIQWPKFRISFPLYSTYLVAVLYYEVKIQRGFNKDEKKKKSNFTKQDLISRYSRKTTVSDNFGGLD